MRIVVTGANRGIGLEFVRQFLVRGDTVEAAVRSPERATELRALVASAAGRLRVSGCDVTDGASVRAFADGLGDAAVDLLLNNAGVMGRDGRLGRLDYSDILTTFQTNAVGALRVTEALVPVLRRSAVRKVVHITSGMGSILDNTSGGSYGYRMSKAALNMASKSLAVDLRGDRIISVVINPGWVQTDMGGPGARISPEESVAAMLGVIDQVTLDQSGAFLNYRGGEYPW